MACDDSALPSKRRIPRIGIQLYTMRKELADDVRGTLQRLAAIGYRDVETAATYGASAADFRRALDETSLEAPSAHFPLAAFDKPQTFDDARVVRHEWLTVSSPTPSGAPAPASADDWKRVADAIGAAAAKTKSNGFRFAYHNHAPELARFGDRTALEILLAGTDPSLVSFQMDLLWVVKGGGDPRALLERFPTRFTMLHVKDSSGPPAYPIVDPGAGTIDFPSIFASTSSVQRWFIEHDDPADAFATATAGYRYLADLRF